MSSIVADELATINSFSETTEKRGSELTLNELNYLKDKGLHKLAKTGPDIPVPAVEDLGKILKVGEAGTYELGEDLIGIPRVYLYGSQRFIVKKPNDSSVENRYTKDELDELLDKYGVAIYSAPSSENVDVYDGNQRVDSLYCNRLTAFLIKSGTSSICFYGSTPDLSYPVTADTGFRTVSGVQYVTATTFNYAKISTELSPFYINPSEITRTDQDGKGYYQREIDRALTRGSHVFLIDPSDPHNSHCLLSFYSVSEDEMQLIFDGSFYVSVSYNNPSSCEVRQV